MHELNLRLTRATLTNESRTFHLSIIRPNNADFDSPNMQMSPTYVTALMTPNYKVLISINKACAYVLALKEFGSHVHACVCNVALTFRLRHYHETISCPGGLKFVTENQR